MGAPGGESVGLVSAERGLLITGGTGSLGRALCRHVLMTNAYDRIVIFSRDEFKQFAMQEEPEFHDPRIRYFLGDVRDRDRLRLACAGVTDIIHAAALKWVASGGYNPTEILRTNVIGTENVVRVALDAGVAKVVVVSSDKSVHATNIYGKSKSMAEEIAIAMNAYSFPVGTKIAAVRYGNVLWSRGSVAYRFKQQRPPYRLTDRRMTRFGMRMSEAVAWVLGALERMRGGDIFVPRLPSFRVEDVAHAVWASQGRRAHDKTPIEIVGHRAGGEKLHEMLIAEEEAPHTVGIEGGWVIEPQIRTYQREAWTGEPVPDGWSYTSDKNPEMLTVAELVQTFREMEQPLVSV